MLLSGPDVLIGGEGKLTAVVYVGKNDSAKTLTAKTIGIRLAMPSNTRLFALMAGGVTPPEQVLRNFDEVAVEGRNWDNLVAYAAGDATPRTNRAALAEIKGLHAEKFSHAMLFSRLRRKHEVGHISADRVIRQLSNTDEWVSDTPRSHRLTAHFQGAYVTSLSSRSRPVQQLRSICNTGLVEGHQLDTGVPYPKTDSQLNVLLVESWPSVRHDPEKPLRSAAFACWIMTSSSGAEDVVRLLSRSREQKYLRRWQRA